MPFIVGAGFSKSFGSFLVCRLLAGIAGAPVLAVGAGTNADMYPIQYRAVASCSFIMMPVCENQVERHASAGKTMLIFTIVSGTCAWPGYRWIRGAIQGMEVDTVGYGLHCVSFSDVNSYPLRHRLTIESQTYFLHRFATDAGDLQESHIIKTSEEVRNRRPAKTTCQGTGLRQTSYHSHAHSTSEHAGHGTDRLVPQLVQRLHLLGAVRILRGLPVRF